VCKQKDFENKIVSPTKSKQGRAKRKVRMKQAARKTRALELSGVGQILVKQRSGVHKRSGGGGRGQQLARGCSRRSSRQRQRENMDIRVVKTRLVLVLGLVSIILGHMDRRHPHTTPKAYIRPDRPSRFTIKRPQIRYCILIFCEALLIILRKLCSQTFFVYILYIVKVFDSPIKFVFNFENYIRLLLK